MPEFANVNSERLYCPSQVKQEALLNVVFSVPWHRWARYSLLRRK